MPEFVFPVDNGFVPPLGPPSMSSAELWVEHVGMEVMFALGFVRQV